MNIISDNYTKILKEMIFTKFSSHLKKILNKKDYILNNWKNILNLYKYELSCPMESQISHNLAYLFTSRPKGYSLKTLNKLLKIRLLFKNNENIKLLYLNNFNKKTIIKYKQPYLNFDIYNNSNKFDHSYQNKLYTPSGIQFFSSHTF